MKKVSILGFAGICLFASGAAHAQSKETIPAETVKANTATKGSTDVAKGGFATGSTLPADEDPKDVTEASVAAGGLFSSGNARTVAITTNGKFKMRRDEHQFSAALAGNFARAGKKGEAVDTTVENYQGLLRYDYFLTDHLAVFLQTSGRRDRFQGLDLRYNLDPGLAYYFINTKKQTLRAELGYDLQHDIRREEARVQAPSAAAPGAPPPAPLPLLDKTQTLHNIRAFLGYDNKLYKEVAFVTSLEYLQNVSDLGTYRYVFDVGLKTNVSDKLAIATTYTMRFENKPLPTIEKADSIASVNLVYTLF
jgi:putative salt-induced outer membrane protein